MKRPLIFLCSIFLCVFTVSSQQVSFEEAERTARNFLGKSQKSLQSCTDIAIMEDDTLFYIFNTDNGFIVISGDKKAVPILAYSESGTYDSENIIPPVEMWLNSYKKQLYTIRNNVDFVPEEKITRSWEVLEKPLKTHKNTGPSMEPLLTSKWGQGKEFNYYCPADVAAGTSYNNRAVAGCVATAMAQIMYYFRFPEVGIGKHSYKPNRYNETLHANFGETQYIYEAMADEPVQVNWAASLLTYHCGVGIEMNYGPNASSGSSYKAASAMRDYFGYSPDLRLITFHDMNITQWDSILVSHLDKKIPLYYSGTDTAENVGHAFVCDGYKSDSNGNYYYHFNWGWDGYADGYFYTSPLVENKDSSINYMSYHIWQQIIINAYPNIDKYDYPKPVTIGNNVLTEEIGSFTDGSIYDCSAGIDYSWIIRPEIEPIQSITLNISFQLALGDTIFITSANGQINKVFTNISSSETIVTSSNELTVRLITTNDTISSKGLKGNYIAKANVFCGGAKQYTTKQGTFNDGSNDYRYNNWAYCGTMIRINGINSITLSFSKFETEKDKDILYISDHKTKQLLLTLSGSIEDFDSTVMTFQTNTLTLIFETDGTSVFDGWELTYDSDVPTGISDFYKENNLTIYPNPVMDYLNIQIENEINNGQIQLFDLYGKLLQEHALTNLQTKINLSNLSSGIYLLKVKTGEKTITTQKVIKY